MRVAKEPVPRLLQLRGVVDGRAPIAGALVQWQQRQARLGVEARALKCTVVLLGAVEETGLEEILGQCVACALAFGGREVGALHQVLVHAHRTLELAAATKQVAQREVQLGGVGVVLAPPR